MIIDPAANKFSNNGTELLWSKESGLTGFTAQTISLNHSKYKMLYIVLAHSITSTTPAKTSMIINDASIGPQIVWCGDATKEAYRSVEITTNGLSISSGVLRSYNSDGTVSESTSNSVALPIRIYGGY